MANKHLKRITAPRSWMIVRKGFKFIARPHGSFSMETGMPLIAVLKDVLNLVSTRKEGKRVLNTKEITVNGVRRKDEKFMIGLMDVLTIKDLGKSYRMLLDSNGVLRLLPITGKDAEIRLCKITGKRLVRAGKVQLSLHDGRTCLGELSYSNGDTLVFDFNGKVTQHLKLEKGVQAYLVGGSNVGRTGLVESLSEGKVSVRIGGNLVEAASRFILVVGKEKPLIKVAA